MKTLRLLATCLLGLATAAASAAPASTQSVERLLEVTRVQAQLDTMEKQMLPQMFELMRQQLAKGPNADATMQAFDRMRPRFAQIMQETMSWDALRPDYVEMYAQTFTQEEVDGLIAFYQSPLGAAVLDKMPQLMQRSVMVAQQRMMPMMRKLNDMTKEEAARQGAKP